MQIVSYRGPSQPGGVSTLLREGCGRTPQSTWWHLEDGCLQTVSSHRRSRIANIPAAIMDGHYRYCNEFLWPLMHGRADLARYEPGDHNCYRSLNLAVSAHLNWYHGPPPVFVHDYQWALLPRYLAEEKSRESLFFWHIPWPDSCPQDAEAQLAEVARGMLRGKALGFHTAEYVDNFCAFVRQSLPEVQVAPDGKTIFHRSGQRTALIAGPAGINYWFWHRAARSSLKPSPWPARYIFSVDRADYSKGIVERIEGIRMLFRSCPQLKGEIQFVFACQPTRKGIAAFDEYWALCRAKYQETVTELASEQWSPIVWLPDALTCDSLARWYAHADALLVTPCRDGLNLTAKEFVASSIVPDGSLILSRGAGVWHELKDHVVTIPQCRPELVAQAILTALDKPSGWRRANLSALKRMVLDNSLEYWWQRLTGSATDHATVACTVA